jgi:hypothetical protein
MTAPEAERFDLLTPDPESPPHRGAVDFLLLSGADALPVWQAFQGRNMDSLVDDARAGDEEASRLLLKTFVLQHQRGAIHPAILDYVAGCLATFTLRRRRVPDSDAMSLADVEESFSLHRPTPHEVWTAFHLDRPRGRPEKAPFTREMSDLFLASCVATVRDSGATVEEAWETVRS